MALGDLSLPAKAALLALMTFVTEASNTDIDAEFRFRIDKKAREQLVEHGLITARKARNNSYVHELTDKGWRVCREEFTQRPEPREHKGYRVLFGVLRGLDAYLTRSKLEVADVFAAEDSTVGAADTDVLRSEDDTVGVAEAAARIRATYAELTEPGGWVSLIRLRAALPHVPRRTVDEALLELKKEKTVYLIPETNQKTLTVADREAAIHIGGEDRHLLSIERG
jgi:hypothetical protein